MSHVILGQTNDDAIRTAVHTWKWTRHPTDLKKLVNLKGEDVLVLSSADRARHALRPADKLYLAKEWLFCHGDGRELIRTHKAGGGAVFEATDK